VDKLGQEFANRLDEGDVKAAAVVACKAMARLAERDLINYAACYPVAHDKLIEALQDYCLWVWKPGRQEALAQFMAAVTDGLEMYVMSDHPARMAVLEEISLGQRTLRELVAQALPNVEIRDEEPIENLYMDICIPELNLCLEYDGRQHYEFTPHFHADELDFRRQQAYDRRKEELCRARGIRLVRVRYDEPVTLQTLVEKILKGA
jgi:very-short-patch-repair endonuclease